MSETKTREGVEYTLYDDEAEALEALSDWNGDQYVRCEVATGLLAAFEEHFEDEDDPGAAAYNINSAIAEYAQMGADARGILRVLSFDTVIAIHHVSTILADAVGADRGSGASVGHARNAREEHDSTMSNIRETLGYEAERRGRMTDAETVYGMDDLSLDLSSAEWVDGAVWVDGTTHDGRDISAGFDPVNLDPVDGPALDTHSDGVTFRAFGRLQWLHDVNDGEYLPTE